MPLMVPRPDDWAEETRANQRSIEAMPIVVIRHRRIAFVFLRATAVSFLGGRRCFQFLPLCGDAPRCALYGSRWPPFGYTVPLMRVMRAAMMCSRCRSIRARSSGKTLNVTNNKLAWRYRWPEQCYSGTLATGGGLLFVGRNDGRLTAL